MWDIKTILKDLYHTRDLQQFINHRFRDDSKIILSKEFIKTVTSDYAAFFLDDMVHTIEEVPEYSLEDLRPTDNVLDIGACIGAFTLKVCKNAGHVYAVEPIMTEQLRKNIELNSIKNITVFDCALGEEESNINWAGRSKKTKCLSLSEIIKQCGGHIDFLKSDCEGGEWFIKPYELQGIRRIEIEIHRYNKNQEFKDFENLLKAASFNYEIKKLSDKTIIIHAKRKHA